MILSLTDSLNIILEGNDWQIIDILLLLLSNLACDSFPLKMQVLAHTKVVSAMLRIVH